MAENDADREPAYLKTGFHCPNCGAYALQLWSALRYFNKRANGLTEVPGFSVAQCDHCNQFSVWREEEMFYPLAKGGVTPHEDMPSNVQKIYDEAREVAAVSRRSAAALLRLTLQVLIDDLVEGSGTINNKIADLVRRGLDPQVQKAMDTLRIAGNEAAHPGTIDFDLDADDDLVHSLFGLVNIIVEQVITRPKHIDSLLKRMPADKVAAIAKRDATST
jgi:hypothetical protein